MAFQRLWASLILLIFIIVLKHLIRFVAHLRPPLRDVLGPKLAVFTRLWYASELRKDRHQHTLLELQRKHGPVVRYAPDCYKLAPSSV